MPNNNDTLGLEDKEIPIEIDRYDIPPVREKYEHRQSDRKNQRKSEYNVYPGVPYPRPQQEKKEGQVDILDGTKVTTGKAVAFALAFSGAVATEYVRINSLENAVANLGIKVEELKNTDSAHEQNSKVLFAEFENTMTETAAKTLTVAKEYKVELEKVLLDAKTLNFDRFKEVDLKIKEIDRQILEITYKLNSNINETEKDKIRYEAVLNERMLSLENKLRTLIMESKRAGK